MSLYDYFHQNQTLNLPFPPNFKENRDKIGDLDLSIVTKQFNFSHPTDVI